MLTMRNQVALYTLCTGAAVSGAACTTEQESGVTDFSAPEKSDALSTPTCRYRGFEHSPGGELTCNADAFSCRTVWWTIPFAGSANYLYVVDVDGFPVASFSSESGHSARLMGQANCDLNVENAPVEPTRFTKPADVSCKLVEVTSANGNVKSKSLRCGRGSGRASQSCEVRVSSFMETVQELYAEALGTGSNSPTLEDETWTDAGASLVTNTSQFLHAAEGRMLYKNGSAGALTECATTLGLSRVRL